MLRRVKNINPRSHITNAVLYNGGIPISQVIRQRRLRLAGHVIRGNESATQLLFWEPQIPRRRGRPTKTLKATIEEDTGLNADEIKRMMQDRDRWRDHVMSPPL